MTQKKQKNTNWWWEHEYFNRKENCAKEQKRKGCVSISCWWKTKQKQNKQIWSKRPSQLISTQLNSTFLGWTMFFHFCFLIPLSSLSGSNLGRFSNVFTRDTPSRADHSISDSGSISSSLDSFSSSFLLLWSPSLFSLHVPDLASPVGAGTSPRSPLWTWTAELGCSLDLALEALHTLCEAESRKRQTTAQSSTLEVGYLYLHARTADSTSARAAEERLEVAATMSTTSLFERTSQICH